MKKGDKTKKKDNIANIKRDINISFLFLNFFF